MQPDFTVIVVNWNGEGLLRECLRSIGDTAAPLCVQTVVVDNGSKDNSVPLVRRELPHVELIAAGHNLGFGAANNLALPLARGEFVMFLNPDARILPGCLQTIGDYLRTHEGVGAVGCRMLDERGQTQPLLTQRLPTPFSEFVRMFQKAGGLLDLVGLAPRVKDPEISGPVVKISGGCLTVRHSILDALGGFDSRFFMYCEDADLCQRIAGAGWQLHHLADAAVTHVQGSCSRQAYPGFSTLMQQESFYKYMAKYFGPFGATRYRAWMGLGSILRLVASSIMLAATTFAGRPGVDQWRQRLAKNRLIFRWAIHAAKATIPD
jgi:GT2 family glycosyltransferase